MPENKSKTVREQGFLIFDRALEKIFAKKEGALGFNSASDPHFHIVLSSIIDARLPIHLRWPLSLRGLLF